MFSALARPGQRSDRLPVWLVLGLFALFVRAVVPSGWMPAQAAGTASLILCSGSGTQAVDVDLGKIPVDHSSDGAQTCAFAAASSPLLHADPLPLPARIAAAPEADRLPVNWIDPRAGLDWQTPPSLGP